MSDHNFEKQIRQKLDELKIPPAGTVWSSVEAQIRKDRRRTRGLILFPMLLLLIGTGFYFIFENNFSSTNNAGSKYVVNSTSDSHDKTDKTGDALGNKNKSGKSNNNSGLSNDSETKEKSGEAGRVDDDENDLTRRSEIRKQKKEESNRTKALPGQELKTADDNGIIEKAESSNGQSRQTLPANSNASILKKSTSAEKNAAPQTIIRNKKRNDRNPTDGNRVATIDNKRGEQPKQGDTEHTEQRISKSKKEKDEGTSEQQEVQKQVQIVSKDYESRTVPDSLVSKTLAGAGNSLPGLTDGNNLLAVKKPADSASSNIIVENNNTAAKKVKQSSWKWGLAGSAGISNLNDGSFFDGILDGIISGEKALVADVSPNAMNNNNAPSPTAVINKPSSIEKGFSFSIGGFIQKNLSKRFSIATGLQYSYYSTKIQVGRRVDSTTLLQNAFGSLNVTQYYRPPVPTTHEYTNRFHFVELPLTVNFKISNRLPIHWNAGLSLAYLVSTNALHFDSQTGVYYKDNSLFNKMQANLSTGLSVSLWNKSKMPVHVGPQLQYGLTNLMKRDVSAAKHLFYFGLNTRIFLKK
jgi:hypothetical protein